MLKPSLSIFSVNCGKVDTKPCFPFKLKYKIRVITYYKK